MSYPDILGRAAERCTERRRERNNRGGSPHSVFAKEEISALASKVDVEDPTRGILMNLF